MNRRGHLEQRRGGVMAGAAVRGAPPGDPRTRTVRPLRIDWHDLITQSLGFIALTALVVNFLAGAICALIFLAASGGLIALAPREALTALGRVLPLLALPLLILLSGLWSEAPGSTTRAGMQVLITVIAAAIIGWQCREKTVILAVFVGLCIVCATGLPQVPDGLASGYPIQGAFGSKNAFGIHAQFLEMLSLAVLGDRTRHWFVRLGALAVLGASLVLVYLSRSGGALTLAGLTLVMFPVLSVFGRFPLWARVSCAGLLAVALAVAAALAQQIQLLIAQFRSDVLGKDATLTGRTELWDIASQLIRERPLLGHGYFSFWRLGNPDAEALWRIFGVSRGGGFNFHNDFVEMAVGIGYVGCGLMALLFLLVLVAVFVRYIAMPTFYGVFSIVVLIAMYVRAMVETGIIAPFSVAMALWVIIASRSLVGTRRRLRQVTGRRGEPQGIARGRAPDSMY